MLFLSRPDAIESAAGDCLTVARRIASIAAAAGDSLGGHFGNLMDAELRAGDALAAVRTGQAQLAHLLGSRDELRLDFFRLNLGAALLALDDTAQAGPVLQAGWSRAAAFEMHPYYADYLTLWAALADRPEDAARLVGYADTANHAAGGLREQNAAAAVGRARQLAGTALGEDEFARLQSEGASLRDVQIAGLTFGRPQVADSLGELNL